MLILALCLKQREQPKTSSLLRPTLLSVISNKAEEHLIIEDSTRIKKGFVILVKDDENKSLEFRRIVVNEKGKGIGRACLQLVKKYCFEQLNYHRIWLDVFDFNYRALHLYKSEGFVEEGKLVESVYREGQFHNLLILSMLQCEYQMARSSSKLSKDG